MINFNTQFESLRVNPKSNSSNKNRRYPTHTTTFSSNKKVTTITQTQRMKKSTFNNKKVQEWLNELEHQMIMNISKPLEKVNQIYFLGKETEHAN